MPHEYMAIIAAWTSGFFTAVAMFALTWAVIARRGK